MPSTHSDAGVFCLQTNAPRADFLKVCLMRTVRFAVLLQGFSKGALVVSLGFGISYIATYIHRDYQGYCYCLPLKPLYSSVLLVSRHIYR